MKLLKSLKKFIKANHIIAILGLFVLIVAINQFFNSQIKCNR